MNDILFELSKTALTPAPEPPDKELSPGKASRVTPSEPDDRVSISEQARIHHQNTLTRRPASPSNETAAQNRQDDPEKDVLTENKNPAGNTEETPEAEKEKETEIRELKAKDQETRTHEAAHVAAGAGVVKGGPTYEFTTGPDGRQYATGGEVSIDTSEEDSAKETVIKMRKVRAAALAPSKPSAQDLSVAAEASVKESKASAEQAHESSEEEEDRQSLV